MKLYTHTNAHITRKHRGLWLYVLCYGALFWGAWVLMVACCIQMCWIVPFLPLLSTFLMSVSIICSVSPHFLDFKYLVMFQFFTMPFVCLFCLQNTGSAQWNVNWTCNANEEKEVGVGADEATFDPLAGFSSNLNPQLIQPLRITL